MFENRIICICLVNIRTTCHLLKTNLYLKFDHFYETRWWGLPTSNFRLLISNFSLPIFQFTSFNFYLPSSGLKILSSNLRVRTSNFLRLPASNFPAYDFRAPTFNFQIPPPISDCVLQPSVCQLPTYI